MKTNLFARLALLTLGLSLSFSQVRAQTHTYSEDAATPGAGYWTITTDPAHPDYSVVRFYTPDHQQIYQERLEGVCLDPSRGTAKCRRTARRLNTALVQVRRSLDNSLVSNELGIPRRLQRSLALR